MSPRAKSILLVPASIVAGLVLMELCIALFYPQDLRRIRVHDPFFTEYDPRLGWVNKKDVEGPYRHSADTPQIFIRMNSRGLRGPDVPYDSTPGTRRVLVLGDSTTFGYVDEEFTYPALLQRRLGPSWEVLNGSVVAYGFDQQYLWFMREGLKYKPDVVLVGFSGTDIGESTLSMKFGLHKPWFRLEAGRLRLMNTPVPSRVPVAEIFFRDQPVRAFLFARSHLYRLFTYRTRDVNEALSVTVPQMDILQGIEVVHALIAQLKDTCRMLRCEPVFVVIPQEDWITSSLKTGGEVFKRAHLAAVHVVQNSGLRYVDLWDFFIQHYDEHLYMPDDPLHLTPRGYQLVAEAILRSDILQSAGAAAEP
jgi:lysophospholipase L1-like esterase